VDGQPIRFTGGMPMRLACADCHGLEGRGLRTPMFISPDITYRNLTDPAGMLEPDGERGPTYTDALIHRAVTQGIDAEGKPLAWPMPRWHLTDRQWQDLLAYLKTLT
jgi:mono/diheme cytochrome c family protein